MKTPLTDRQLKVLGPGEHGVGGVPGLALQVTPAGHRSFVLRYRTKTGDRRAYRLGRYPDELSLAEARERAADLRKVIRAGGDPVSDLRRQRDALRMTDLFGTDDEPGKRGWYLETYVFAAGKLVAPKSEKGIRNDRYYVAKHIRSRKSLMRKAVADVQEDDLLPIKAAATVAAWRKVRQILMIGFRYAESKGVEIPGGNPAAKIRIVKDGPRERFLDPEERRRLELEMAKSERLGPRVEGGLSASFVRLFRILALTGMRRGEGISLRWEWIDGTNASPVDDLAQVFGPNRAVEQSILGMKMKMCEIRRGAVAGGGWSARPDPPRSGWN